MRRLTCILALAVVLLTCALAAGQCDPCTIWAPSATPGTADSGDPSSVELGVKFQAASAGYISGIRFYKSAANVGTHIGNLWSDAGVLLATAQFTQETPSGWQQVNFSTPVLISANTTYVASYFAPLGHYSADNTYFTSSGYSNPPLDALGNGVDGPNGVFNVGSTSAFPASNVNPSNYWVDVVYVSQGETAAPTIVATNPASGSSGAAATSSISASFSSVMNPATITSSSFQLVGPSNNAISGTVSYSSAAAAVVFQPNASLAYQTTYTAVVQGTVQDFLGNSLGNNFSWTFTTGYGPSNRVCPCTIFPVNSAPSVVDSGDGTTIEVGVKFRADVSGFITGIRFYKAATNTGTHIGNLWTIGGSLLESVVFTGETASGWQQAIFATPVPITAGTTYVASYFAPVGHYSFDEYYLTNNVDNSPLHALSSSSSGGNGVFIATASSAFPSSSFNATNYGVDVSYLLQTSTTPPVILSATPGNGATGISLGGPISVQFNEPMNATTIIGSAFQLADASNNVIPGTVTYVPSTATMQFQPSLSLLAQATYTATVYGTVQDAFGNALGASYSWSFTTAPPPGDSGPGGPILVIASSVNPFSSYLSQILLNEGLNEFRVKDITTVTPTVLSQYDVAILGDFALTSAEASMLSTWVSAGGSLIAMHPDPQLATTLGLTATGGTLSDQYMLVNTGAAPGTGIYGQSMQFHGPAELFTLNGATAIANLYSSQTTPTVSPAVTIANSGSGQAAAFTYDLSRSVVYTRQGNPAWAGQQRDPDLDLQVGSLEGGTAEIRASDLFYGNASFDPEPDWVNLNTVQVPQADEQQRLFTNLIQLMNSRRKPLPRFWYLPNGYPAAVVMTGDDHGGNGTQPRFDIYVSQSPANCSVANWTCVRATSYVFPANVTFNPPTSYTNYIAEGFEIANHSDNLPTCTTFTAASLDASIVASAGRFTQYFPLAPASQTNRTHCVLWSDFDSEPTVLLNHGIRFDTSYYYWPDSWVQDRPGLFTGSGLPMRYSDHNGNTIDVYQATTQFPDETTWTQPGDIDTVLANATGPLGFYAVITANMHTDNPQETQSDQIVAAAQSYGVPVVASLQMLQWLDGRNNSTFSNMSWASNTLSFTVTPGTNANNLEVMVPATSAAGPLVVVLVNGVVQPFALQTVKGLQYATFLTTGGAYQAVYGQSYSVSGTISGPGGNGATVTIAAGTASATTTANASGAYTFTGVPNGVTYTVTPGNGSYTFTPASQSVAVNGANVNGVNFATVVATYSLSGTISGAGGNGATVTLSGAATATTTASATGTYTFSGLANGAYTVTPSKAGYSFSPTSQAATVNGANLTVNFSSTAATYTISGTISGAGGNGATVTLSGAATATTTASATGTYTFSGVANGAYTVTPSKTGYTFSPTSQAATVSGANLTVNFSSAAVTYTISGTISGAGGNGATVTLSGAAAATTTASATGTYTFSGLANGAYTVTPSKSGYTFSPTSQAATVNGANLTVNFSSTVVTTYTISGTISGPGANGATVKLSGAATATTTASSSGTYTFSGLANGAYTVTPSMAGYTYSPASQSATVNGANLTVNFSSTVGLTAVNLSSYFNIYGIATSGNAPKSGGLDGSGDSYNSSTLGLTATYQGITYTLGPANAPDGVNAITIPVAGSGYSQLYLLGSASYGEQSNQSIVVTYSDGTTSTFTQSISDWWAPLNLPGETNVTAASNIILPTGAIGNDPVDLYGYTFNLTAGKTAVSVKLPANRDVVFLAMGLGSATPTAATPAFNPLPGTFSPSTSVSLSDTTAGAVIHYTTNNTAPSATSPVYSAAIPVTATTTIQAIAVAPGYSNSAVANGTYTIATYSISGTISGAGGNGATVTLSGATTATTTASSTGTYTFSGLGNGAYTVTPSKTGYSYSPTSQAATVNGANLTVNFSSSAVTYSISGTISGAGGNGATVTLSGAGSATTTASSTGAYTFSVANGAYTVTPSKSGYTFAPASQSATVNGANLTGVNFSSATATYSISGTVSGAGGNGATVTLSGAGTGTTTASSTGTFTFSGLANGAYTVTPSKSGFSFTPSSSSANVSNANLTGVNFATVTYSISGTISGLGGNGATVTLSGAASATTTASSTGTYTFSGLTNGAYTVTPSRSGFTFTPASLGATVSNANVTGVNFATVTYTISGTISGAGGNAATVALTGAATATTTASSTGTYSFSGLANGAYTLTPSKPGYSFSPTSQSGTVSGANLTVNFSSTTATFSISGTISGAGANGATVMLNGTSTGTTTASSSGTYSFSGLSNGPYSVTPVMTGYNYSPTSQVIALNGANITANFSSTVLATAVNLSSYYNVYGIATIGNVPKSGGFDNESYAFNSSLLGASLTYQNLSFPMSGANALDAVDNKTITLPSGQYGKLFLLGAGVNGNQANQPIVVTYSDGSTTTFTQNFSDWATPQSYTGETTVSANASRIGPNGQTSPPPVNVYGYTFILNAAKTVLSVKLPANRNVVFVGIGVGSPTPTPITPYVQVNGAAWQTASTATVAHGSTVNLGPQPLTGTWSWIGPSGFTSTAREIDKIPLSVGVNVFVSTYTGSNGAQTVQPFVITSN